MNEVREYELLEAKSENGIVTGLGNTIYEVDRYGDIVIGYVGLDQLVKDGFIADSHGLDSGNGKMGDYTYKGMAGIIQGAKETDRGLQISWEFDPSSTSQDLRKKVEFRIDNHKSVATSIGFRPVDPVVIYKSQYETLLPKYIPASKLPKVLADARAFSSVRVLKTQPHELSLAPRPVNANSIMESYKNEGYKMEHKVEFSGSEFKTTFFGKDIADTLSMSAIERLYGRLSSALYNIFFPYPEPDTEDEAAELANAKAAIAEFASIATQVIEKMQSLELIVVSEGEALKCYTEENFTPRGKKIDTQAKSFEDGFIQFKADAERFIQWRKSEIETNFKSGKTHSTKTEKQLVSLQTSAQNIKESAHGIYKDIEDMLCMPDEGKNLVNELEARLLEEELAIV